MRSILVLAPHPDDESLACSGIIRTAILNGDSINIVVVTNGDYLGKDIAKIRYYEFWNAMKKYGLSEKNVIWLGFADTGMNINKSFLYKLFCSNKKNISSPYSKQTYHPVGNMAEFAMLIWNKHLTYNRDSLLKCLNEIVKITDPDEIYLPSIFDLHGDHKALNLFMNEVLEKVDRSKSIKMFEYIIHGGDDKKWPQRQGVTFVKPPILSNELWGMRSRIRVPNEWDKLDILKVYKSQISGSGYIESFSKDEEIFWIKEKE